MKKIITQYQEIAVVRFLKFCVTVCIVALYSNIAFAQNNYNVFNYQTHVQFKSNLPGSYMHFFLLGDGYYSKERGFSHEYKSNVAGYNTKLYSIDAYDKDEPELSVVNTGSVNNPVASNPPMPINGVIDSETSWDITDFTPSYVVIRFQNDTNIKQHGCIEFDYDPSELIVDNSNTLIYNNWVQLLSNTSGKLKWNFNNLDPNEQRVIYLPVTSKKKPGSWLTYSSTLKVGCVGPGVTNQTSSRVSNNPHDPNKKYSTTRKLSDTERLFEETGSTFQKIDYVVEFVNDGAAPVTNVVVVDNLEPGMDPNSVTLTQSTHSGMVNITGSNQVEFIFNNIDLPGLEMDGVTLGQATSRFAFSVCYGNSISTFDCVGNDISIYFDNLPPIHAEAEDVCVPDPNYHGNGCTANTTLPFLSGNNSNSFTRKNKFSVYPNPTSDWLSVSTKQEKLNRILITTIDGKVLNDINGLDSYHINIPMQNLESGTYFIKFVSKDRTVVEPFIKI